MDQISDPPAFTREQWMTLLAQSSPAELDEHWRSVNQPSFSWIRRPEYGAAMIRGRASGTGALFNMGEVTVTRCSVRIGSGEIGLAYVMGRSKRHAALAALFDGLMQRECAAAGSEVARCIAAIARAAEARRQAIVRDAASSKVDFFMLGHEGGNE
jgi:alpha-D-ribose 1-methylphosphonate 5-triphosphate synthase subunit PhnG